MRRLRPILILLAVVAWMISVWQLFGFSFQWRADYDAQLSPHDGQIGLDAFAFALLVCFGYIMATLVAVLAGHWVWHRRRHGRKP